MLAAIPDRRARAPPAAATPPRCAASTGSTPASPPTCGGGRCDPGSCSSSTRHPWPAPSTSTASAAQTQQAGAKLLLVGDHHQLSAVDAGGAFRLLARTGQPTELRLLWRFRNRWEANASRKLRDGDPTVIADYHAHGRVHGGPAETMLEQAYTAWRADQTAGHTVLLIAADTATVTTLNQRVHDDRVDAGIVTGPTITLGGALRPGPRPGRRRRPHPDPPQRPRPAHPDRAVRPQRRPVDRHRRPPRRLPRRGTRRTRRHRRQRSRDCRPAYVAEHVDLGYAITAHRAQGVTVDRCHVLAHAGHDPGSAVRRNDPRPRRQHRLRRHRPRPTPTATTPTSANPGRHADAILARILRTSGAELSATETIAHAAQRMRSLRRLAPIRGTIAAAIDRRRWPRLLHQAGLSPEADPGRRRSPAAGPLYAALRRAEHLGHNTQPPRRQPDRPSPSR